ncbi:MAG TPA: hypothetical protein VMB20_10535 [Candidatus Acidoferrum sp.]|nr:hypothetical protein [Candidatus Acidoferrum sp.]
MLDRREEAVKELTPVLAAGGTFAGATVAGLLLGILVAQRTAQPLWAFGGLMFGFAIGAYGAVRLLMRSV